MKFKVDYILHPEESGGFSVEFPWIPNCFTCGDTAEEAHRNAREVAQDIIVRHFAENPGVPLFEYAPWDWDCAPGETFEVEIAVPPPRTSPASSSSVPALAWT